MLLTTSGATSRRRIGTAGLVMGLLLLLVVGSALPLAAQNQPAYEVWLIDQADYANGGNRLYVFAGDQLGGATAATPEIVDLQVAATGVGDGPGVRPHLLLFNNTHSHGILAAVASGHVLFIRASDRSVVGSVDVGEQAHGAVPAPDDRTVIVANQNGKRLARIRSDFATEQFVHEVAADLDLGALEDATHPDNAPICPLVFGNNTSKVYVSMRGGGLYVVDTTATPMRVVREYGNTDVAPAGCGGVALGDKLYLNSGTASSSDVYVMDTRTDAILKHIPLTQLGVDAHGMVLTDGGRYLWVALRGSGRIAVIDTTSDEIVNDFSIGAARRPSVPGAAPDLIDIAPGSGAPLACSPSSTVMCLAPGGDRVFMSMRGPNPLTGGQGAAGERTGLEVQSVTDTGRAGTRVLFLPIGEDAADVHGIAVRLLSVPNR
jgi:DNA-binding beta-propeller fold protein YncE